MVVGSWSYLKGNNRKLSKLTLSSLCTFYLRKFLLTPDCLFQARICDFLLLPSNHQFPFVKYTTQRFFQGIFFLHSTYKYKKYIPKMRAVFNRYLIHSCACVNNLQKHIRCLGISCIFLTFQEYVSNNLTKVFINGLSSSDSYILVFNSLLQPLPFVIVSHLFLACVSMPFFLFYLLTLLAHVGSHPSECGCQQTYTKNTLGLFFSKTYKIQFLFK